jgi:glucose-1-phosphate cytidylyltransferase
MDRKTDAPVVILAGGKGMRMRELTESVPKALAPVGPLPIIVHVMSMYRAFGYHRFILCLGYKGDSIREYFRNYPWRLPDLRIRFNQRVEVVKAPLGALDGAEITFVDTGLETNTGGRLKRIERYIDTSEFLVNYCDGLSDVSIDSVHDFHREMGRLGTLVAVKPMSRFGIVESAQGVVQTFREKPQVDSYINGGFFVFGRAFFDYLDDLCTLEREPLQSLARDGQLAAFNHDGFWYAMDTAKEFEELNTFWETGVMPGTGYRGRAPWLRGRTLDSESEILSGEELARRLALTSN